ncbi:hypothetical protein BLS_006211 [Venturia inaequalis]|uniref:Uncharacterized protein n=1 Tax=Venturia inaequalis TaxID=5025 RepID=A0A8H3YRR7_VENIN|nr:hypothetical protein BLS_006211 [Venturia inaequalis]KAE9981744.1 hypothetical protein EG328_011442 [Venturia inaequalis]
MAKPQQSGKPAGEKDSPAVTTSPKHDLQADNGGSHQAGPHPKKVKITEPSPPSNHLIYMRENYERYKSKDDFDGRLAYWTDELKKNKKASDWHKLGLNSKSTNLDWEDCHIAILSVTQAILDSNNTPMYGIFNSMVMYPARLDADKGGDTLPLIRIAPAKRPLIMAWMIGAQDRGESMEVIKEEHYGGDIEAYRKALVDREKKKKMLAEKTKEQEENGPGQHIVCVAAEIVHTSLYPHGMPSIRVFDSLRAGFWNPPVAEIVNLLTNLRWYYGDGPVQSLPEPVIIHWPEVSTQNGNHAPMQTCGIHTILNGWTVAIGMGQHIISSKTPTREDYRDALRLVELVYTGCADFWLIYDFLSEKGFIRPPYPLNELKALRRKKIDGEKVDTFINTLAAVGAQFFDRTVGIPNEQDKWQEQRVNEAMDRENNGGVTPDTSEIQAIKSVEEFEREAATQPERLKNEIQSRVKRELGRMTKNPDFDDETMATLARACSHLAWFVRQRMNGGTVSGREVAAHKTFEQLAGELLGRNFHLSAIMMHAMATVVHELYDGDRALSPDVLREFMRSMEEGRYPDADDFERIQAATDSGNARGDNHDNNNDDDDDNNNDNDNDGTGPHLPSIESVTEPGDSGIAKADNEKPDNAQNGNDPDVAVNEDQLDPLTNDATADDALYAMSLTFPGMSFAELKAARDEELRIANQK